MANLSQFSIWCAIDNFGREEEIESTLRTALTNGGNLALQQTFTRGTPLHHACSMGKVIAVRALMTVGADPTLLNVYNNTPATEALIKDHAGALGVLRDSGVDIVNQPAQGERSALHLAVKTDRIKCIPVLLDAGADPLLIDEETGSCPAYLAAQSEASADILAELHKRGVGLSIRNETTSSTLAHEVASRGCVDSWATLLEAGVDVRAINGAGMSAIDIALLEGSSLQSITKTWLLREEARSAIREIEAGAVSRP